MIMWGVYVCGVAHVLIIAGGAKALLDNGTAKIPFFIGVYILSIGAGKPARTYPSHLLAWNTHLTMLQPCSNPTSRPCFSTR